MGPDGHEDADEQTKPQRVGTGTPADYGQTVGISHVVEMIMQMQETLGGVSANIDNLKTGLDKKVEKSDVDSSIKSVKLWVLGGVLTTVVLAAGLAVGIAQLLGASGGQGQ